MSADEIQQREKIDPDDVHKMPVEPEVLHKRYVARGVSPGSRAIDHECQNSDADDHVYGVHAGHGEIEKEVEFRVARHVHVERFVVVLGNIRVRCRISKRLHAVMQAGDVMLLPFLVILNALDAEKDQAESKGKAEAQNQPLPAPCLRAPHAHGHCEAGGDQRYRVRGAPKDAQLVRAHNKGREIPVTQNQVSEKQPAEKHDFSKQKEPHGKVSGVCLLLDGFKVMAQKGRMRYMSAVSAVSVVSGVYRHL